MELPHLSMLFSELWLILLDIIYTWFNKDSVSRLLFDELPWAPVKSSLSPQVIAATCVLTCDEAWECHGVGTSWFGGTGIALDSSNNIYVSQWYSVMYLSASAASTTASTATMIAGTSCKWSTSRPIVLELSLYSHFRHIWWCRRNCVVWKTICNLCGLLGHIRILGRQYQLKSQKNELNLSLSRGYIRDYVICRQCDRGYDHSLRGFFR